jgi:hypothetical protein
LLDLLRPTAPLVSRISLSRSLVICGIALSVESGVWRRASGQGARADRLFSRFSSAPVASAYG